MNEHFENARRAFVDAASNPKVATFVGVSSASAGGASQLSIISGVFAEIGVILGTCTTAVVLVIQLLKLSKDWRARKRGK